MTDLDRILDEIDLAGSTPGPARRALALELHRLRKLEGMVRAKKRALPALVTHWLDHQPAPVDLTPPAEKGSSADLLRPAA